MGPRRPMGNVFNVHISSLIQILTAQAAEEPSFGTSLACSLESCKEKFESLKVVAGRRSDLRFKFRSGGSGSSWVLLPWQKVVSITRSDLTIMGRGTFSLRPRDSQGSLEGEMAKA